MFHQNASLFLRHRHWVSGLGLPGLILLCASTAVLAQSREQVIESLEHAIGALQAIDRQDAAHELEEILADYRQGGERGERAERGERSEREVAMEQLETLRVAMHAFREAEESPAADLLERVIHARELALEGVRGEEAAAAREAQPGVEQQIQLLHHAAELWADFGNGEKSERVAHLARQMGERELRRQREREQAYEGRPATDAQHQQLARRIEIMQSAFPILAEAGREDTAELLERAVRVHKLMLEGVGEREMVDAIREAPGVGELVEILMYSSKLAEEFGRERDAGNLAELAGHYRHLWEDGRAREEHREWEGERPSEELELNQQIEHLQHQIHELNAQLEELSRRLHDRR